MSKNFKKNENIHFQSLDDIVYILDISSGEYYELSKSASLIWELVIDDHDDEKIEKTIIHKYKPEDSVKNDIQETISNFIDLGFIKRA